MANCQIKSFLFCPTLSMKAKHYYTLSNRLYSNYYGFIHMNIQYRFFPICNLQIVYLWTQTNLNLEHRREWERLEFFFSDETDFWPQMKVTFWPSFDEEPFCNLGSIYLKFPLKFPLSIKQKWEFFFEELPLLLNMKWEFKRELKWEL